MGINGRRPSTTTLASLYTTYGATTPILNRHEASPLRGDMTRAVAALLLAGCSVNAAPSGGMGDDFVPRSLPCRSYVAADVYSEWACSHRDHRAYPTDGGTACLCPVKALPRDVWCCDLTDCDEEELCPGHDDAGADDGG